MKLALLPFLADSVIVAESLISSNMAGMDLDDIDPADLRTCMLLALDFLVAHRVARDHAYDIAQVTAARDTLEQRVLLALRETDVTEMPDGWSWKHAAHEISVRVALAIVEEDSKRIR